MRSTRLGSACWFVDTLYVCLFLQLSFFGFFSEVIQWFIQEEEAMARKAKEEEAAALEFEIWKGEFSVDAEGTTENELQDGRQGLLFDFVEYIKVFC